MRVPDATVAAVITLMRHDECKRHFETIWNHFTNLNNILTDEVLNPLASPEERHTNAQVRAYFKDEVIDLPTRCLKQVEESAKQE